MRSLGRTLIFSILIICASSTAQATKYYRGNIFLEMMLAMMDLMGIIDYERDYYRQPYPNFNQYPASPWSGYNSLQSPAQAMAWQQMLSGGYPGFPGSSGLMMPGATPWANPMAGNNWGGLGILPGTTPEAVIPYLPQYFNQYQPNTHARSHWIEGRWLANDNMVMEVRQGKFTMYYRDRPDQVRGGLIRIKDHWLAIAETTRKIVRQYEYAYKKDLLVLRDSDGNIMFFRRLTNWPLTLK